MCRMLVSSIHKVFLFCFHMQIFIDCGTTGTGIREFKQIATAGADKAAGSKFHQK